MARSIKLADDLYQELGDFGNRDESWNDVLARVLVHVDEDAALEDRNNRATTYNSQGAEAEDSELSELPDGTIVRHRYQRGDYGGETVEATIQGVGSPLKTIPKKRGVPRSCSGSRQTASR